MVFSSNVFLFLYLPLVLAGYFLLPRFLRNGFLLLASLFFYSWGEGFYVLLMLASILLNYIGGLVIERLRPRGAKIALGLFISINLLLLGAFKYANFLVDNINLLIVALGANPVQLDPVHLPIGISFFTFQAMSYVIDVYRGEARVQRNPVNSSLYIALFPQLIAGPIVRYHDIAAQLTSRVSSLDKFSSGVSLFIIGLGKKMLIANPAGEVADQIFAIPAGELDMALTWLGVACYTLQIYFDFSGYSDMAIGLGRMFGFEFKINFNYPYISQSIREFWRRWHISLSRWFRDYLYFPLGGNRRGPWRTYFNLFVVFLLCGFWHGASWNFVIWGLMHGGLLVLERTPFARLLDGLWRPLRHAYVLLAVMVSWVFFRADELNYAVAYLAAMFGFGAGTGVLHPVVMYFTVDKQLVLIAGIIGATPVLPWIKQHVSNMARPLQSGATLLATVGLAMVLALSAMYLAAGTHNPFIYFRF